MIEKYLIRMYDCDGNGWIDLQEMTRLVGSIYKMLDNHHLVQHVRSKINSYLVYCTGNGRQQIALACK